MFTVFCASVLYIAANGGEAHVTDVARLQLLTKVPSTCSHGALYTNEWMQVGHCERNHICTFYDGIENLTRNFLRTYRHTELALGAHLCYGWDQHSIFARRFLLLHFSLWRQPRRLCPATTEDEMHVEKVGFVHGVPVR